jgi:N-glycosylase/DNA lyase
LKLFIRRFAISLVGDRFRELWGDNAGWASTVLFVDDLKDFSKDELEKSETKKKPKKKVKRLDKSLINS